MAIPQRIGEAVCTRIARDRRVSGRPVRVQNSGPVRRLRERRNSYDVVGIGIGGVGQQIDDYRDALRGRGSDVGRDR